MLTAPIAPVAAPAPTAAAPAPAQPQPVAPQPGAVRLGVADTLRTLGEGANAMSHEVALVSDKSWIYPVEAAAQGGRLIQGATAGHGKVLEAVGNGVNVGLPYAAGFYGLIFSGMLSAPGAVAKDLADGVADHIDGQQTRTGFFGFEVPGAGAAAAVPPAKG